jgi:hypothetical protein
MLKIENESATSSDDELMDEQAMDAQENQDDFYETLDNF